MHLYHAGKASSRWRFYRLRKPKPGRLGPRIVAQNDSSIQRGDRADTGDNEAQPDEMGAGFAMPTVDPTAFGASTSFAHAETAPFNRESELRDTDGIEIMEASDGRLGLTDVGNKLPEDWAADTGEARTPEGERS